MSAGPPCRLLLQLERFGSFATFVDSSQELSTRYCPSPPASCLIPRRARQECPKALRKADVLACKYINSRTRSKRLGRRTICFSKMEGMPDLVIGLLINRPEGRWSS